VPLAGGDPIAWDWVAVLFKKLVAHASL